MFPIEDLPSYEQWGESLLDSDLLQNISDPVKARRWVDKVVRESRPLEVLRYVGLFLRAHPLRDHRRKRQKGGAVESECDDTNDSRIYRFLALADSVHDGHHRKFNQRPESIMRYMQMKQADLPNGCTTEALTNEEHVIQFLQRRKYLNFGRDKVENPLHGADLAHFDVKDARVVNRKPNVDVLTATYNQAAESVHRMSRSGTRRTLCVPVYSALYPDDVGSKLQRIRLAQILDLAARIRMFLGRRCVFQPDTYHPLIKFFTATKLVDAAFFRKFVLDQDFHVLKYEHEIRQALVTRGDEAKTEWGMTMCDANYYDGSSIADPLPLDTTATGTIFRHGIPGISAYNIRLEGLSTGDKVKFSQYINNRFVYDELDCDQTRDDFSTGKLFSQLPGARRNQPALPATECCRLLNLKRAGDWSQVEACKRHARVFLTADRLAALYAFYRSVPFLLIRIHDYQELGTDMIQYSCCLGRA